MNTVNESESSESVGASRLSSLAISESMDPDVEVNRMAKKRKLSILDGKFFEEIDDGTDNVENVSGLCVLCKPLKMIIKGNNNSSSNFISHIRRRHGNKIAEEYFDYLKEKKRKTNQNIEEFRQGHHTSPASQIKNRGFSQPKFDEDVTKFIIHSMVPLKTVEDPFFKEMFSNFRLDAKSSLKIISRRTLTTNLHKLFEQIRSNLKLEFQKIQHFCTTADIWSGRRRSFLGVTCHWISSNFERKSAALACRRFFSDHSHERIAELLRNIHLDYGLTDNKLTATITDNGSNFVKAFKTFGIYSQALHERDDDDGDEIYVSDSESSGLLGLSWEEWWTYDGISGPNFWGRINPEWSLCHKGRRQSPVNLEPAKLLFDPNLRVLDIDKLRVSGTLSNTGHSVLFKVHNSTKFHVNFTGGPLSYRYLFDHLVVHFGLTDEVGSEHTINGLSFPAELQIFGFNGQLYSNYSEAVQRSQGIAAISVLLQLGDLSNPELRLLTDNLDQIRHGREEVEVRRLSIHGLLPDTDFYMTYDGSTTAPPCHETLVWLILNKPIYITKQQLHALRRLMQGAGKDPKAPLGNNYRPPQPLHHRPIRTNIDFNSKQGGAKQCPSMYKEVYYKANNWKLH